MREATIRRADSAMDLIERLNRVGAYVNGKSTGMPPPSSSPPRKRGSRYTWRPMPKRDSRVRGN